MKFKFQEKDSYNNYRYRYVIFGQFRPSFRDELRPGLGVKCDFENKDVFKEKGFRWDPTQKVWFKQTLKGRDLKPVLLEILSLSSFVIERGELIIIAANPLVMENLQKICQEFENSQNSQNKETEPELPEGLLKTWLVQEHDEKNYDFQHSDRIGGGDDSEGLPQLQGEVLLKNGKRQRVVLSFSSFGIIDSLEAELGGERRFWGYYAVPWQNPLEKNAFPFWGDWEYTEELADEETEELDKPEIRKHTLSVSMETNKSGTKMLVFSIEKTEHFDTALSWVKMLIGRKWDAESKKWKAPLKDNLNDLKYLYTNSQEWRTHIWCSRVRFSAGVLKELEALLIEG
jgi:hypothetical protein